jgi:hypothetical protein
MKTRQLRKSLILEREKERLVTEKNEIIDKFKRDFIYNANG